MHRYEDLLVYQKSLVYTRSVRECSQQFPKNELYCLTSQFRRAADSIVLNIVEGAGNYSDQEFSRFLTYSIRSGFECKGCIDIACINGFIPENEKIKLKNDVGEIIAMLDGLHKHFHQ
jgi:four helix bundle protein